MLLLVVGCAKGESRPAEPGLRRLDAAIVGVGSARADLLAAVGAVERAASALDRTDELCVAGKGQPARAGFNASVPLVRAAREGLTGVGGLVLAYSSALDRLRDARGTSALRPAERTLLENAVRDGRAEAAAVERFRGTLSAVWPSYDRLFADQAVWTGRAAAGWYRGAKEAAAAYSVLVLPDRQALRQARSRLAAAASGLDGPTRAQTATLRAADRGLGRLRDDP